MQSVTTSSRAGIVERFSKIVPTKEPLETASRRALPVFVMRESKSLETGRDGSIGLHRLLIETREFAAALPKTVGANRAKCPPFALCVSTSQRSDSKPAWNTSPREVQ